jgi:hypothetical protein
MNGNQVKRQYRLVLRRDLQKMKSAGEYAKNLSTIGSQRADSEHQRSIGTELSRTDYGTCSNTVVAATGVQGRSVVETAANVLQSLPQQLSVWIAADGNTASLETRWRMYGMPDRAVLEQAVAVTAGAMVPASRADVLKGLTKLRLVTKARDTDPDEMAMANEVIFEELTDFPGDVVRDALLTLSRTETFFPPLAEIREACHRKMGSRARLHAVMTRALEKVDDQR